MMILKILFGQRIQSYPGQFAPEPIACMNEYEYDDYPVYLEDKVKEAAASGEFENIRIFDVKVDQDLLTKLLNEPPAITGEIEK